jgi:type II secretory pathway pseudopilin PulG
MHRLTARDSLGRNRGGRDRCGKNRQSGYMLLFLMMAVAMLTITLLSVAANYRRTILRDREVEMIHRGVQYERAVRLYYKKFQHYPTSIEQLENTNKIRFLRKRYKDPMTPDGAWQVAHITDIKLTGLTGLTTAVGGAPASNPLQASPGIFGSSPATSGGNVADSGNSTAGTGSTDGAQQAAGSTGPVGSSGTGPLLGGGPMLGVISKSKAEGIHSFNGKGHYNEWYFIYDPGQEKGQQLTGPYNPNMLLTGGTGLQSGTPASPTTSAPTVTTPTQTPGTTMAPGAPATPMP